MIPCVCVVKSETAIIFSEARGSPIIMDKSLGTNLHLWRFFTRAKQTVTCEFNYTCSAPSPILPTMLDTCTRNFSTLSTLYNIGWGRGAETNLEKDYSAFLHSVLKAQIIHAMIQVSQGILSTIVACTLLCLENLLSCEILPLVTFAA